MSSDALILGIGVPAGIVIYETVRLLVAYLLKRRIQFRDEKEKGESAAIIQLQKSVTEIRNDVDSLLMDTKSDRTKLKSVESLAYTVDRKTVNVIQAIHMFCLIHEKCEGEDISGKIDQVLNQK